MRKYMEEEKLSQQALSSMKEVIANTKAKKEAEKRKKEEVLKKCYAVQNMTEEQKQMLIQQKVEKKRLVEKKKAEIEALKKQIIEANKRGDTDELKRLVDIIKDLRQYILTCE